jgi:hypothetical protein
LAPLANGSATCSDECARGWAKLNPPLGDPEADNEGVVQRVHRRKRDLICAAAWKRKQQAKPRSCELW